MALKVVVGAGAVGAPTALLLAEAGHHVRIVSRRGTGPVHPNVEIIAVDASDVDRLADVSREAQTLYNCVMPRYDQWTELWPPIAASLLTAVEKTGADYVMVGNAYGYGPVDGPITEDLPLVATTSKGQVRAQIWRDAKASFDAVGTRVTEVRAFDYLGPAAISFYTWTVLPSLLVGEPATFFPADLNAAHSWTYTVDAARTAIAAGESELSWGRAWHVPSVSDLSVRAISELIANEAGTMAQVSTMSQEQLAAAAAKDSMIAQVTEMLYMLERPTAFDASETRRLLGVEPSPLKDVIAEIVEPSSRPI